MRFMLYGSDKSRFLKGIKSRAGKNGIKCEITQTVKPNTFYVKDWETFKCDNHMSTHYDLEYPIPSVVQSVMTLISTQYGDISGKTVLIIGRGNATKGLANLLLHKNATPIISHTRTENLSTLMLISDIIINAAPSLELDMYSPILSKKLVVDLVGKCDPYQYGKFIDSHSIGNMTIDIIIDRMADLMSGVRKDL